MIGIIIEAGVFIGGLEVASSIKSLINASKTTQSAAPLIGTFGPMLLAILRSGSGDAAGLAFKKRP